MPLWTGEREVQPKEGHPMEINLILEEGEGRERYI